MDFLNKIIVLFLKKKNISKHSFYIALLDYFIRNHSIWNLFLNKIIAFSYNVSNHYVNYYMLMYYEDFFKVYGHGYFMKMKLKSLWF